MRLRIATFAVLWCVGASVASATDIYVHLDSLVARGNRAYEMSYRTAIKTCADSIALLLATSDLPEDALLDYTVSLNKLHGNYFYEAGELDSAANYYLKARQIIDRHPHTSFHGNDLLMLRELAQLHYRRGDYHAAREALERVNDRLDDLVYDPGDDNWLTTRMTYAITLARLGEFEDAVAIGRAELDGALDKTGLPYAKAKRMMAKILLLADTDSKGTLKAYKEYFAVQKRHAEQNFGSMNSARRSEYWQTLRPFITDCFSLEDADPEFLYDVALFSKGLLLHLDRFSGHGAASQEAVRALGHTHKDIAKKLRKNEAAIEFIEYEKDGERRMAALLLTHDSKVKFIPVGTPAEVAKAGGKALNSTAGNGKSRLYRNKALQTLVWTDSLLSALTGVKRLYFSPDGYLHRLGIEYFPQVEEIAVYRLSSTRRLMEKQRPLAAQSPMLLVGNIDYDAGATSDETLHNDTVAYARYQGKFFPRLNGATDETAVIFASRGNTGDTLVNTSSATEGTFRELAPRYNAILISTHGDFCAETPVATDVKEVYNPTDLSENIIAFAGVNPNLGNAAFDAASRYDGLLSAAELCDLPLDDCRLFCVSACQSGLGEITSDGIFGLQRGLKNAGADAIMVSLWSVNDEATSTLMTLFFENINRGMTVHESFRGARREMKSSEGNPHSAPQYTDAFILIDAI